METMTEMEMREGLGLEPDDFPSTYCFPTLNAYPTLPVLRHSGYCLPDLQHLLPHPDLQANPAPSDVASDYALRSAHSAPSASLHSDPRQGSGYCLQELEVNHRRRLAGHEPLPTSPTPSDALSDFAFNHVPTPARSTHSNVQPAEGASRYCLQELEVNRLRRLAGLEPLPANSTPSDALSDFAFNHVPATARSSAAQAAEGASDYCLQELAVNHQLRLVREEPLPATRVPSVTLSDFFFNVRPVPGEALGPDVPSIFAHPDNINADPQPASHSLHHLPRLHPLRAPFSLAPFFHPIVPSHPAAYACAHGFGYYK